MAGKYAIPEKVINFNLYNADDRLFGVTGEVKLPSFEEMSETMSGAGILGEYESGTPGHFSSMEIEIPFSLAGMQPISLMDARLHTIFLRGSMQLTDIADGERKIKPLKITLKTAHKSTDLGKVFVAQKMETTGKQEVLYIKIETDNQVILELDKLNFVYVINGKDQLAEIRAMI